MLDLAFSIFLNSSDSKSKSTSMLLALRLLGCDRSEDADGGGGVPLIGPGWSLSTSFPFLLLPGKAWGLALVIVPLERT